MYNQGTGDKTFKTERQQELGVDFTKYRVYDPALLRFWQVDPKADQAGQESWTTYHYSFNNPVRWNDPLGDCPDCPTADEFSNALATDVLQLKHSLYNVVLYAVGSDKRATFVPNGDGGFETGFVDVSEIPGDKGVNALIDLVSVAATATGAGGPAGILAKTPATGAVDDVAHSVVDVISETTKGKGNITSAKTLTESQALDAGIEFAGKDAKEIGKSGSGVYRSTSKNSDGSVNQFRMDKGSLSGSHDPNVPHVHLEIIKSNNKAKVNNHIPIKKD